MKDLKVRKKALILLTSFTIITTGCSNKSNEIIENNQEAPQTKTQENVNNSSQFDNFESEKKEFDLIYTENFKLAEEIYREYFIDAVDMIFYDKEYKNTKFYDLNQEAQQEIIDNIKYMGTKVEEKNPNWKNDLDNIKNSSISIYYDLLDTIKKIIEEENYNEITNFKNNIKEEGSKIGNIIKENASEWYQEYKNKSK